MYTSCQSSPAPWALFLAFLYPLRPPAPGLFVVPLAYHTRPALSTIFGIAFLMSPFSHLRTPPRILVRLLPPSVTPMPERIVPRRSNHRSPALIACFTLAATRQRTRLRGRPVVAPTKSTFSFTTIAPAIVPLLLPRREWGDGETPKTGLVAVLGTAEIVFGVSGCISSSPFTV